jgi:Fe-S-cluster containining protein
VLGTPLLLKLKAWLHRYFPPEQGQVVGQYYIRSGSCNGCGRCCTDIYIAPRGTPIQTEAEFEAEKQRDPQYRHFDMIGETDTGLLFRCQYLKPDNTCADYDNRPDFCRRYPAEASLLAGGTLAKECSYTFELIRTFGDVLSEQARRKTRSFSLDGGPKGTAATNTEDVLRIRADDECVRDSLPPEVSTP